MDEDNRLHVRFWLLEASWEPISMSNSHHDSQDPFQDRLVPKGSPIEAGEERQKGWGGELQGERWTQAAHRSYVDRRARGQTVQGA